MATTRLARFNKLVYSCAYATTVDYEWDPEKARVNQQKHGVRFLDAVSIFQDDRMVLVEDTFPFEERYVAIGTDAIGRVLVVVFAWRGQRVRVISARKAERDEVKAYEGET